MLAELELPEWGAELEIVAVGNGLPVCGRGEIARMWFSEQFERPGPWSVHLTERLLIRPRSSCASSPRRKQSLFSCCVQLASHHT